MLKAIGAVIAVIVVLLAAAWLWLRGPDIPYAELDAKYADDATRFVDLPGGFHVHYEDHGDPNAPLLVLLHGFGDSYTTWEGWVRELDARFRVISLDFPGHGLTRAPPGYRLTGPALADFVAAFAQQLSLPRFSVAGNSLGGAAAWQLAVRHPDLINALILVDAGGWPPDKAPDKAPDKIPLAFRILQYPIGRALLRNIDNRPLIADSLKADVYDKTLITPAFVDRWAEFQRAPGHRAILMDIDFAGAGTADAATLSRIAVPTLVINGENDTLVPPSSANKFVAAIPHAQLRLYPKVGHLPQIEVPLRSAADVAVFLQTVVGTVLQPEAPPQPHSPHAPASAP